MSRAILASVVLMAIGCGGEPPQRNMQPDAGLCGNGRLDDGESCDPGVASGPGTCPTSCDDADPCTIDQLVGSGCGAKCKQDAVTTTLAGDGCCPHGASANTDSDCTSVCGNKLLEAGETCDTAIHAGAGACPSPNDCDDHIACTTDAIVGQGCTAQCSHTVISKAQPGDGCCPAGATAATDSDCSASCGDGVVQSNERCDTGISSGSGSCPQNCDDGNPCTQDLMVSGGTCAADCVHTPIAPGPSDGCCPTPGILSPTADHDCPAENLFEACLVNTDCASNVCRAFDAINGTKICTQSCDGGLATLSGGCPAAPDVGTISVCVIYPHAGVRSDSCLTASGVGTDSEGGVLGPNSMYAGTISPASDVDLFVLPEGPLRVTVTPQSGLDTEVVLLDDTFVTSSTCTNGYAGAPDVCLVGGFTHARTYFFVASQNGLGGTYALKVEAQ